MSRPGALLLTFALALAAAPAGAQDAPHHRTGREIFAKLISFRTAEGHKQVPAMADYIVQRLRAGGLFPADIVTLPHGEAVALLVRIPGTDPGAKPILFSGHMDIVDARPEDWERDPFTLIEQDGRFYGRGTIDNKAGIASLVSTILRMKSGGREPRRTLLFAFIGDEETGMQTTRAVAAQAWVRDAEFAINTDAGGGSLDDDGRPTVYLVQGAEKTYADFRLVVTNPGGHSSWPRTDNAIYDLARALSKIERHRFPVMANELTRSYLRTMGTAASGPSTRCIRGCRSRRISSRAGPTA